MDKKLIDRYIVLPLVINVLKQDREEFKKFKMERVYLNLLESAIDVATKDFHNLKRDTISKHHLNIKKIDGLSYTVNGKPVEYITDELKDITDGIMRHYLSTVDIEWEDRMWNN